LGGHHLAGAHPDKGIAAETGFAEVEVKVLVQSVMRKLRMKNRTAVAIFAATARSLRASSVTVAGR
jgi:DNA-binding NarL/FixJ family response regulator